MTTVTVELDDELVRYVEEAAKREHKSLSEWVKERVKPETDRVAMLAAMEARATANGYPAGWLTLFGSLAGDESFNAPTRGGTRSVNGSDFE
jgi:hypothetical protein